ncbi:MAG: hypothetical protein HQK54_11725 [Oligoflexales bacterium]|nr:hypothetical protein [Oligoflexales bacterium]
MMIILGQGGLHRGGLNFDAKLRRNSTDLEDMFIAHIGGMDTFARGLEIAHDLLTTSKIPEMKRLRYDSFNSTMGKKYEAGGLSLRELAELATSNQSLTPKSGKQEMIENIVNQRILLGI